MIHYPVCTLLGVLGLPPRSAERQEWQSCADPSARVIRVEGRCPEFVRPRHLPFHGSAVYVSKDQSSLQPWDQLSFLRCKD
jgi:hypothetical protein